MRELFFSTMITMMLTTLVMANDVKGKVVAVIDGNTLKVVGNDDQLYTVLLAGIDSPELNQEFGQESKKFLEKLILNKNVTLTFKGKDRMGNTLAEVVLKGKKDPRMALLEQGFAWTSEKNPLQDLEAVRSAAQVQGKGLWKQDNPTPPWVFRREQSMLQRKSS